MSKGKVKIDVSKLIKLRDQIAAARKLDYVEQQKHSSESRSHAYRLGKQHALDEIHAKLDDLIIQG